MPDTIVIRIDGKPYTVPAGTTVEELESTLREESKPATFADKAGEFAGNAMNSAGNFVGGLYDAVTSPVQTIKSMGNVALGAAQKLIPGTQDEEKYADAIGDFYKNRYGSMDAIKNTLWTDPVGAVADASSVLTGGAGVLRGAGLLAGVAGKTSTAAKLANAAKVTNTVADVANPVRAVALPLRAAKKMADVTGVSERFSPRGLMGSALKPSTVIKDPVRTELIDAAIKNRIMPSSSGLAKTEGIIDDMNAQFDSRIAQGTGAGETVLPSAVARRVDDLRDFFGKQAIPDSDMRELDAVKAQWMKNHSTTVQPQPAAFGVSSPYSTPAKPAPVVVETPIPIAEANQIKSNTYAINRKKYDKLGTASSEGEKALARGIKEEIMAKFPELEELGQNERVMINLKNVIERMVVREGNHQLTGIGTPLAISAAGHIATNPTAVAAVGVGRMIIDNPQLKAALAIALDRVQRLKQKSDAAFKYIRPGALIGERIRTATSANLPPAPIAAAQGFTR